MKKVIPRFSLLVGLAAVFSLRLFASVTITEPIGGQNLLADKALNWSTLGYFFIPVLMHLLSAALLIRLRWSRLPLSETGARHARDAAKINWIILGVAAICAAIVGLLIWAPWKVPMTP